MSRRQEKVASLLRVELSQLFLFEVSDPTLQGLSVQEVTVTPDLKIAKVYYSLPKKMSEKEVSMAFKRMESFLRKSIAERSDLRYVPKLEFIEDEHQESLTRIYKLFNELGTPS